MTDTGLYDDYHGWKGWGGADFMVPPRSESAYLDVELAGAPVRGEHVLDIGFGNGWVLGWARAAGAAKVYGTELNEQVLGLARERGVETLPADFAAWPDTLAGSFGTITAFDVLEHLSIAQIHQLLDRIALFLRPGGRFLARFPNGQSPFGIVNQAGDITHVTSMSGTLLEQMIGARPLRMLKIADMFYGPYGTPANRIVSRFRALGRRAVALVARGLYSIETPLAPNVVIVMERTGDTAPALTPR